MAATLSASLRAWLLCAPACVAMLVANILPACRELLGAGPRPLEAEIAAWGISFLVVGAHVLALAAVCLTFEAPLALAVALVILHRTARTPPPARWLAPVIAAGFAWRLLFGGTFGFAQTGGSLWSIAALEAWRTLPLSALLFYVPLRRAGAVMTDVARLDGAAFTQTVARVYLPICRPAALALVSAVQPSTCHGSSRSLTS